MNPSSAPVGALARCVALSPVDFAERHWGREALLTRACEHEGGFGDLLDSAAVDELVSQRGLRTPFARMAKDGTVLARSSFTRGAGAGASIDDQLADDGVLAQLASGATLVLQALHRTWPPIIDFAIALTSELGHPVQVNAYVTPAQGRGFAPHYDLHDVFVIQIEGRKHWTIHEPVITDPLDDQPWERNRSAVEARSTQAPLIDAVLSPGDVLYLPRGTIHAAQALGETSIHLTVGVHPVTRYQLLRQLIAAAQEQPELRASLPMGVDLADPDVLAPELADTIRGFTEWLASASTSEQARRMGDLLRRQTRPAPLGPLKQLELVESLDARTPLRLREGDRATFAGCTLTALGRVLTVAEHESDAAKAVLAGGQFTPAELPGLATDAAVEFARRLLLAGIVTGA